MELQVYLFSKCSKIKFSFSMLPDYNFFLEVTIKNLNKFKGTV